MRNEAEENNEKAEKEKDKDDIGASNDIKENVKEEVEEGSDVMERKLRILEKVEKRMEEALKRFSMAKNNGNIEAAKDDKIGDGEVAKDEELVVKSEKRKRAERKRSGKEKKWQGRIIDV